MSSSTYVYNSATGETTGGSEPGLERGTVDAVKRWLKWDIATSTYLPDAGLGVVLNADIAVGVLKVYEVPPDKRLHNFNFEHLDEDKDFDETLAIYETNTLPADGSATNNYLGKSGLAYGPFRVVRDYTLRTVPNPRFGSEKKYLIVVATAVATKASSSLKIDIDSSNPFGSDPDKQVV